MTMELGIGVPLAFASLILTLLLIRRYAARSTPYPVLFSVTLAWFLCFSGIGALFVVDIIKAGQDNGADGATNSPSSSLEVLWNTLYWLSFVLTWLVIPVQQEFYKAGDFSVQARLWSSLRSNMRYYAIVGALFLIFIIYIAIKNKLGSAEVLGFAICLSNLWGLALCVLLLGYGLVELPKWFWKTSNRKQALDRLYYGAVGAHDELEAAKDELADAVTCLEGLRQPTAQWTYELAVIRSNLPEDVHTLIADRRLHRYEKSVLAASLDAAPELNLSLLSQLNYSIMDAVRRYEACSEHWEDLLREEIEKKTSSDSAGQQQRQQQQQQQQQPHQQEEEKTTWASVRVFAGLLGLISATLLWSELVIFTHVSVTPLTFLPAAGAVAILFHLTAAAMYALWKLRLLEYYRMRPNRRTDQNSLLFNAAFTQRLIAPLCYNFASVMRLRGTTFQRMVGKMDIIPFLGGDFNVYFPVCAVVISGLVVFDVLGRTLKLLGMTTFEDDIRGGEDTIQEGKKMLLSSARRRHRDDQRSPSDRDRLLLM